MIKYLLSIFSILILVVSSSQGTTLNKDFIIPFLLDTTPEPPLVEDTIYKLTTYMPHFVGCEEIEEKGKRKKCSDRKLITFINQNLEYPPMAREAGIEGMAVVRFIIEKDGSLNFNEDLRRTILRDPGGGCGKEALRVLQSMSNWVPGKENGQAVRVQFTMPIRFELTDDVAEVPEFQEATIKWDGYEIKGQYKTGDPSEYVKAECTLDKAMEIMSARTKGIPLMLKLAGSSNKGFTQYYLSVGKTGKKHFVSSTTKNKGLKQKVKKALKSGEIIYFYNWEYKKTVVEISVK